ncbi:beta-agarase [Novipirellula sp. SH528]|uniref:beta-agarase n=1 Tax=Novipirellula sp. SH528 TaxID=3454466 RepID=UPI003FA1632F
MVHLGTSCALLLFFATTLSGLAVCGEDTSPRSVLFDFEHDFDINTVEARGIEISLTGSQTDQQLQLAAGHATDWPGITLKPEGEYWDGSQYQQVSFDFTNLNDDAFELGLRIDNVNGDSGNNFTVMTQVGPGESRTISGKLYNTSYRFSTPLTLEGMHASPGQSTVDPEKIVEVIIFLRQPREDHLFTIDNVRFETLMTEVKPEDFLPFIDEFGQFIHDDWPGKTHDQQELIDRREKEKLELEAHAGPESFDRFGGWNDGPQLEPAKFFRTQKVDGKWWLVNPDGKLFWSHGIDSVSTRFGATGIQDREQYFRNLPKEGDPMAQFYSQSTWAFGFYASRTPFKTYNFFNANLFRKYGEQWRQEFADLAHERLRSWGMNTLASWADSDMCQQDRTPFVAFVHVDRGPVLAGAQKMWTQFHDVFDPKFREAIAHGIETCKYAHGNPWCIGYYVDNELYWGNDLDLAKWTLASPAEQVAKHELIEDLQTKYVTIGELNSAWGTDHQSWDGLLTSTQIPDLNKAGSDLRSFTKRFSETYFRTVDEELEKAAPGQLYLGCRFIWDNPTAIRAACDFCDVVSFNRYLYDVENLGLPQGEDKPLLIGEFHFGAMDRGMFHPSKVPAKNQQHRAECYKNYVSGALRNPLLVGTHWFEYTSEPTAGRGDGENYQVGFVDCCDTPYVEIVEAAREIGNQMYESR